MYIEFVENHIFWGLVPIFPLKGVPIFRSECKVRHCSIRGCGGGVYICIAFNKRVTVEHSICYLSVMRSRIVMQKCSVHEDWRSSTKVS